MPRHHFVPQFLLEHWATKGKLVSFRWNEQSADKLLVSKPAVRKVCQIEDLYSYFGLPRGSREVPETNFFTPVVDTPADKALKILLEKGTKALSDAQRIDWARLIVSFPARTPETMLRMGPAEYRKAMEICEQNSTAPPEHEAAVRKIISDNMRSLQRNVPINISMELTLDPQKILLVANMDWWIRRFDRKAVLLSDRPLLSNRPQKFPCSIPLNDPACLIVLPISPEAIFFASANSRTRTKIRSYGKGRLLHLINTESIKSSVEAVFALNRAYQKFIRVTLEKKHGHFYEQN